MNMYTCMFHQSLSFSLPQSQGTEEQKKKWLPLAKEYKILGTYAQTELGHGVSTTHSNVYWDAHVDVPTPACVCHY